MILIQGFVYMCVWRWLVFLYSSFQVVVDESLRGKKRAHAQETKDKVRAGYGSKTRSS